MHHYMNELEVPNKAGPKSNAFEIEDPYDYEDDLPLMDNDYDDEIDNYYGDDYYYDDDDDYMDDIAANSSSSSSSSSDEPVNAPAGDGTVQIDV